MDEPGHRLYTGAAVRELDRRAIDEQGVDAHELMCRAGAAAFRLLRLRWPDARSVLVCCGGGNNGGDGLVVGRLALAAGLQVTLRQHGGPDRLHGAAARAHADFVATGGRAQPLAGLEPTGVDVVIDGLLGTGLDRPVRDDIASAIDAINAGGRPVLALDVPSGLDADSGAVRGTAIVAHATMTFIGYKRGLFTGAAARHCGSLFLDRLGTPDLIHAGVEPWSPLINRDWVAARMPRRLPAAHKGMAGRLLVVAGNEGMAGAARLAGEAGLRAGAGLVTVATRPQHTAALTAARPELMTRGIDDPRARLPRLLAGADAVVVGPGLGRDDWARAALATVLADGPGPRVIDADGLNLLAAEGWQAGDGAVLTPHPGEAARLLGQSVAAVEDDRFAAQAELVRRGGAAVVVLKGAGTLVGPVDGRVAVAGGAIPALATGGTGDVLAGAIGGLLAQGCTPGVAAAAAAWLHAAAARRVIGTRDCGLLAGDLLPVLGDLRAGMAHG